MSFPGDAVAPDKRRTQVPTAQIIVGFVAAWLVLDRSAAALASFRGEWGVVVCLLTVLVAAIVEMKLTARKPTDALLALGLRLPNRRGLLWALRFGVALLLFYPLCSVVMRTPIAIRQDWAWLAIGLFAQGGIAEEVVFRGFLFRHMREGRSFWRAALIAAVPFVAVHLLIFLTLDFALAFAAVLVSASTAFPLSWLFERSGNSIWPGAIAHFVIQGSIKLVVVLTEAEFASLAIVWLVLSAIAPWAFFAMPRCKVGKA